MQQSDYEPAKTVQAFGLACSFGVGGLHGAAPAGMYEANDEYEIVSRDVVSEYPHIIVRHKVKPRHISDKFFDVFDTMLKQRVEAKSAGNKLEADGLKLILNSTFGKMNNITSDGRYASILADPKACFAVTLHGQFLIAKLAEMLYEAGSQIIQINTDAVMTRSLRSDRDKYDTVAREWEQLAMLDLEPDEIAKIYQADVNSYIEAQTSGKVKAKGRFATGSGNRAAVVGLACQEHVKSGGDIATFVRNVTDPRPFLMPLAIKHPFHAELGGVAVGNVNRYYHSKRGLPLFKRDATRLLAVGGFSKVAICSKMEHMLPPDLDIDAYISEAEELLGNKQQELNLF